MRKQLRSAAVGADARLIIIDSYDGFFSGAQILCKLRGVEILRRIVQRAELKFLYSFKQQSASLSVKYGGPFRAVMISGFLRENILRKLFRDGCVKKYFFAIMARKA